MAELRRLKEELSDIAKLPRTRKGPQFERFVEDLLRSLGGRVYRSATPEADRVISFHGNQYRVECRSKSGGVLSASEIRDFIERIRAGPALSPGILMTDGTQPRTASKYLNRAPPQMVLVIEKGDILGLLEGRWDLDELLESKRLGTAGGIVGEAEPTSRTNGDHIVGSLGRSGSRKEVPVLSVSGAQLPYLASGSAGPDCTIFSSIWYRGGDRSFVLEADPVRDFSVQDAKSLLEVFDSLFGLSDKAAFAVSQDPIAWHGFGGSNFLRCLRERATRYRLSSLESYHHTETALFVDEIPMGGWRDCIFWIACQPSTSGPSIDHVAFGFMFSDLPFVTSTFEQFFKTIGETPDGYETWEGHRTHQLRLKGTAKLSHPKGFVLDVTEKSRGEQPVVRGLIVDRHKTSVSPVDSDDPRSRTVAEWIAANLNASGTWITDLRGWHEVDVHPSYSIQEIRGTELPAPGFGGCLVDMMAGSIFRGRTIEVNLSPAK